MNIQNVLTSLKKKALDSTDLDERASLAIEHLKNTITKPMFDTARQTYNQNFNPNNPRVRQQRNENQVLWKRQKNVDEMPVFTPLLHQVSAKLPVIPNTVEKTARFIPDKIGSAIGVKPENNIASNVIGGIARGIVEEDPRITSGNKKLASGQSSLLTEDEKNAMREGRMNFVGGIIAGPIAKGFKPNKTGAFSNLMDKKPRLEIDDSKAKLIPNNVDFQDLIEYGKKLNVKIPELLDHPELYKNYPQLRKVDVELDPYLKGSLGSWNGKSVKINPIQGDANSVKSTLLHEIQHAIQQKEGFARGGSPAMFKNTEAELITKIKTLNEGLTDIVKQKDFVSKNYGPAEEIKRLSSAYDTLMTEKLGLVDQLIKSQGNMGIPGSGNYQRLAGEVESRAVQRRMDMPMSKRLTTDPYADEMKATGLKKPQDTIVRFDESVSDLSTKGKMRFSPKKAMTSEEINIVDEIISNFNKTKDLSAPDASFIDRILTGKATATLDQLDQLTPAQRMNEIGKFANISERANGVNYNTSSISRATPDSANNMQVKEVFESQSIMNPNETPVRSLNRGQVSLPPAKTTGWKDIRGNSAQTDEEIASLLKDFRNPREETLHFVYVKDGKVIAHNAINDKTPNSVGMDTKEIVYGIGNRLDKLNADAVYMAHNHPSGFVKPSDADIQFTNQLKRRLGDKLKTSIILDHDRMSVIKPSNDRFGGYVVREAPIQLGDSYKSDQIHITSPRDLIKILDEHWNPNSGQAGLIITNPQNQPIGYEAFSTQGKTVEQINNSIRQFIRKHRGSESFLALPENHGISPKLLAQLGVRDVVVKSDNGLASLTQTDLVRFGGSDAVLNLTKNSTNNKNKAYTFDVKNEYDPNLAPGGVTKAIFSEPQQRGDITKLQSALDEALGTDSYKFNNTWQAGLKARESAKKELEYIAESTPEATNLLKYVNELEDQIADLQYKGQQSRIAKDTAEGVVSRENGMKVINTSKIDLTESPQLQEAKRILQSEPSTFSPIDDVLDATYGPMKAPVPQMTTSDGRVLKASAPPPEGGRANLTGVASKMSNKELQDAGYKPNLPPLTTKQAVQVGVDPTMFSPNYTSSLVGKQKHVAIPINNKEASGVLGWIKKKAYPVSAMPKEIGDKVREWEGTRNIAKVRANDQNLRFERIAKKLKLSPKEEWELVKFSEITDPVVARQYAKAQGIEDLVVRGDKLIQMMRAHQQYLFLKSKTAGLDLGYIQNHIFHTYKEQADRVAQAVRGLGQRPAYTKTRDIPTYIEAEQAGFTPRFKTFGQLAGETEKQFHTAVANRNLMEALDKYGLISPADIAPDNYKPLQAPGIPRQADNIPWSARPDMAEFLDTVFGEKKANIILRGGAKVAKGLQNITLVSPGYRANAFTLANANKDLTTAIGETTKVPLTLLTGDLQGAGRQLVKAGKTAWSGVRPLFPDDLLIKDKGIKLRNAPFDARYAQEIEEMAQNGIPYSGIKDYTKATQSWFNPGQAWNEFFDKPTFAKYLFERRVRLYRTFKQSLSNLPEGERQRVASEQLKRYDGIMDDLGRDSNLQEGMSTAFLAPKWRESVIGSLTNAVIGPIKKGDKNYATSRSLAMGMITTYLAFNQMNRALNDGKNLWENPPGREFELVIPNKEDPNKYNSVPWMMGFTAVPRRIATGLIALAKGDPKQAVKQWASLGSMPITQGGELIANEDYFGRPIYDQESDKPAIQQYAEYVGTRNLPVLREPIKEALKPADKRSSTAMIASRMLELPIRQGTFSSQFYNIQDKHTAGLSPELKQVYASVYQDKKPDTVESRLRNKMMDAQTQLQYPEILEARRKIEFETAKTLNRSVDPYYSLTPEQQKIILLTQSLPPGDKTADKLTSDNIEWLKPYWKERDTHFDTLNLAEKPLEDPLDRMIVSDEIRAVQDKYFQLPYGTGQRTAYLNAHPELTTYWDEKRAFENDQRALLGLPPIEDSFGGGGWGKKSKKLALKNPPEVSGSAMKTDTLNQKKVSSSVKKTPMIKFTKQKIRIRPAKKQVAKASTNTLLQIVNKRV